MERFINKLIIWIISFVMIFSNTQVIIQAEETYQYSSSGTESGVTLNVQWNEPSLGTDTIFHVSASGGTGRYKYYFDAPTYYNPGESYYEVVKDSSRYNYYTNECEYYDYSFAMTATGTYGFRVYVMDLGYSPVVNFKIDFTVEVSDENYPSVNAIINNVVSQNKTSSEYQTALNLHDWLIDNMEYDSNLIWSSAEAALTRHKGTCQSYEAAYAKLLNAAGIENSELRDTADGHTWNSVKLDGEWYQIDCTWDDSTQKYTYGDQRHLYFGLTDELMALAHKGHTNIYTASGYGTRSTNLIDNYYVKSGDANKWAETYRDRIQAQLNNKFSTFTISADNTSDPESISGIFNGIIAYAMNQMILTSGSDSVYLEAIGDSTQFTFTAKYYDSLHEHTYGDGVITKQATCTTDGIKTFTCSICNQKYTESIPATGHTNVWQQTKAPTCTNPGSQSLVCTKCGSVSDTSLVVAKGHNYYLSKTVDSNCSSNGYYEYKCSNCGSTYRNTIKAKGHSYQWISQGATCESSGYSYQRCTRCGNTINYSTSNAFGHSYYVTYNQDATCWNGGRKDYRCSRCGKTYSTTSNALGHSWSNWTTVENPTTSREGKERRTCSRCNSTEERSISKLYLETVKMYRLYNPNSGEHFYTSSTSEKNNLTRLGWNYEGVGWNAPKSSNYPVYRMYNSNAGEHHYTMSATERDNLVRAGWKYEGIGWYSMQPNSEDSIAVKREYNPNAFANNHNYTVSTDEHNMLIRIGWKDEGNGWYAVK